MSPSLRPSTRHGLLLIGLLLWTPGTPLAAATSSPASQPWMPCLHASAHRIGINPILLQAIVQTESRGNPLAFGWTDHRGHRHSWSAPTQEDATLFLHRLLQTQHNFDSGLTQINVQNIPRLTKQLGIHPLQILDPCTNLKMSAIILEEAIAKHGNTWRAVAAYNGSLDYIPLVWTNLCRVHAYPDCPRSDGNTVRARPPAPTDPLRLTRVAPRTVSATDIESSSFEALPLLPGPPPARGPQNSRSASSAPRATSQPLDLPAFFVTSLVPFSLLIATIVVIALGLRIILWALRGVRTSYLALKAVRLQAPDYTSPPDLHSQGLNRRRSP